MKEVPFIKLFSSPREKYFFDVNKDTIINISEDIYEYLEGKKDFDELSDEDRSYYFEMKNEGLLSGKHISIIEHPELENIESHLKSNCNQLILQVTQACNLVCFYCPYANKTGGVLQRDHSNKKMTWETAKKAIDFFYEHSVDNDSPIISFYGGEPLIAFDLVKQCVLYSEELFFGKNLTFSMTSNSTLFTEEIMNFVADHKFGLMFSIDGPEEIHDINRKKADGSGSFREAYANMAAIAEIYKQKKVSSPISVNLVINPQNDLDRIIDFYEFDEIKKYNIIVQAVSIDNDLLDKEFTTSDDYISKLRYHYFLALLKELKLVDDLKVAQMAESYAVSSKRKIRRFKNKMDGLPDKSSPGGPCIPGERRMFVTTDGSIYPCERVSEVSKVMKIGNIYDGFDLENAKALLNVASITAEKCKNCYAVTHCAQCAKTADTCNELSAKKRMESCKETFSEFDSLVRWSILQKESCTIYKRRN